MGDDSPGKVQALRAMFAEKNKPVMGMMPPGGRIPGRPWKKTNSFDENVTLRERSPNEQIISVQNMTKVLPYPVKRTDSNSNRSVDAQNGINGLTEKSRSKIPLRPNIGLKPTHLSQQGRTNSSSTLNSVSSDSNDSVTSGNENSQVRTLSDNQGLQKSQAKSKAMAEAIASFMFSNTEKSVLTDAGNRIEPSGPAPQPPVPKPRISQLRSTNGTNQENSISNTQNGEMPLKSDFSNSCSNLITSDNYISKSNCYFRRKDLPSKEKLGSAPLKPFKPPHLKLPSNKCFASEPAEEPRVLQTSPPPVLNATPQLPQKPPIQRPSYPCPPRPVASPPLPPTVSVPVIKPLDQRRSPITSLREEIEELYEDTLLQDQRPVSLIPEYTEEEERGEVDLEELYNDADVVPILPAKPYPMKPKEPPPPAPPRPSEYLQPKVHHDIIAEELYQDALEPYQDQFYEEMPVELTTEEEQGAPLYSNNRKEIEKLRREEEKRVRKEQKEKEKKEKEMEKMKRKFGLTGDEVPIDAGLVKADCRGGKGDLPVKRGETVLILRMEGNPSGRWLVKNEKGKIGYVELTNIEVDPDSVKSVMTIRRLSVISASEELYSEAMSEEEAIYEVTY